jgi:ParB family chromosome partitioning protein
MNVKKKEKQKHLGRGLASLLGPITIEQSSQNPQVNITSVESNLSSDKTLQKSFQNVPIDSIKPNPYQPRTIWDQQQLEELAESIKTNGLIQPVIVRPAAGKYEMITGERRLRAAKLANLTSIPAIVRNATDEQLLEMALIENIHRTDLNPVERAHAYKNYLETFSMTQTEAAQRLGENRSTIANHIRLLELPELVKQMLIEGQLTMGHARAILALPTDDLRSKLANRALAGRLSVREVEKLVRKQLTASDAKTKTAKVKPAHIHDLEDKLIKYLGTKVSIETRKNGQRGKIIIDFYSLDEFDGIIERIGLNTLEEI